MQVAAGWGIVGLIETIGSFEPERGLAFTTFAVPRIKGSIIDELRRMDRVSRGARARIHGILVAGEVLAHRLKRHPTHAELAAELGVGVGKLQTMLAEQASAQQSSSEAYPELSVHADSAGDLIERAAEDDLLHKAVAALPEQQRTVIVLSFWDGLTFAEIGTILGVTESRVCQVRRKALAKLRQHLSRAEDAAA